MRSVRRTTKTRGSPFQSDGGALVSMSIAMRPINAHSTTASQMGWMFQRWLNRRRAANASRAQASRERSPDESVLAGLEIPALSRKQQDRVLPDRRQRCASLMSVRRACRKGHRARPCAGQSRSTTLRREQQERACKPLLGGVEKLVDQIPVRSTPLRVDC